jgi:phage terminase small subunit
MAQTPAIIPAISDDQDMGPAMRKLLPQQRAWVVAFLETGPRENAAAAARAAQYGADSPTPEQADKAARVAGNRLRHDPKVLDAIHELAKDRFRLVAMRATEELVMLLKSEDPKVKLKAIDMILARTGLNTVQEVNVKHSHDISVMDDKAMIRRIALLAQEQGMDPIKLLGSRGVVIDADFEVVDTAAEPAMSSAGLEDLL